MIDEIIDYMIDSKRECMEYKKLADKIEDEEVVEMLLELSDNEHNAYKMFKSWLKKYIKED